MIRYLGAALLSLLLSFQAFAQNSDIHKAAQAIIASGSADAVEQLIELGSQSVAAASAVIQVTVEKEPRLLAEVMLGMRSVMGRQKFQVAVETAISALGKTTSLAMQVADTSATIEADSNDTYSEGEVAVTFERTTDTTGPGDDGTSPEPPPTPGAPDDRSVLQVLLDQIFELLGIDPPVSPA